MSRLSKATFWAVIGFGTVVGMSHVIEREVNRYRLVPTKPVREDPFARAKEEAYAQYAIPAKPLKFNSIPRRYDYEPRRNQIDDVWNPYRNEWSSPAELAEDDTHHLVNPKNQMRERIAFAWSLLNDD